MGNIKKLRLNSMGSLNHLPPDILLEILTRLPTESVLGCKLVCKSWRYLVSHHPSFSRLHLTRLNHSLDSDKLSFLFQDEKNKQLHYFEYKETPSVSIRRINFVPPFTSYYYTVVGSFNGLVCLYGDVPDYAYCICNLVTKEYIMLPSIKRDCDDHYSHWLSGFGYLPLTNEYKVVGAYTLNKRYDYMEVMIYTLGSGKGWRTVGRLDADHYVYGVSANGVLYWMGRYESVLAFDLTEEKFRKLISRPDEVPPGSECMDQNIWVWDGDLYYANAYYSPITKSKCGVWLLDEKNDILSMKEQLEHEPSVWIKKFSHIKRVPLAFTKSGNVLCFYGGSLAVYDPIASTEKELVSFPHFGSYRRLFPHKNTLSSLKELGEGDIKMMKSAETVETESRYLMTKQLAR